MAKIIWSLKKDIPIVWELVSEQSNISQQLCLSEDYF